MKTLEGGSFAGQTVSVKCEPPAISCHSTYNKLKCHRSVRAGISEPIKHRTRSHHGPIIASGRANFREINSRYPALRSLTSLCSAFVDGNALLALVIRWLWWRKSLEITKDPRQFLLCHSDVATKTMNTTPTATLLKFCLGVFRTVPHNSPCSLRPHYRLLQKNADFR